MKKISISTSVLAITLAVAGCDLKFAREAGYDRRSDEYGVSTRSNFASQAAYTLSNERLLDLNKDFQGKAQDTVTFAFDSAQLDATARKTLDTQVQWLKSHPGVKMTIVGHTDLVGSQRYNKGLGLRRARAVLRYLSRSGISRKRLAAIDSRGELEPVVQTEERERRNRRSVTKVSGFARNYVGLGLDGVYAARVYDTYQAGNFGVTEANSGVN